MTNKLKKTVASSLITGMLVSVIPFSQPVVVTAQTKPDWYDQYRHLLPQIPVWQQSNWTSQKISSTNGQVFNNIRIISWSDLFTDRSKFITLSQKAPNNLADDKLTARATDWNHHLIQVNSSFNDLVTKSENPSFKLSKFLVDFTVNGRPNSWWGWESGITLVDWSFKVNYIKSGSSIISYLKIKENQDIYRHGAEHYIETDFGQGKGEDLYSWGLRVQYLNELGEKIVIVFLHSFPSSGDMRFKVDYDENAGTITASYWDLKSVVNLKERIPNYGLAYELDKTSKFSPYAATTSHDVTLDINDVTVDVTEKQDITSYSELTWNKNSVEVWLQVWTSKIRDDLELNGRLAVFNLDTWLEDIFGREVSTSSPSRSYLSQVSQVSKYDWKYLISSASNLNASTWGSAILYNPLSESRLQGKSISINWKSVDWVYINPQQLVTDERDRNLTNVTVPYLFTPMSGEWERTGQNVWPWISPEGPKVGVIQETLWGTKNVPTFISLSSNSTQATYQYTRWYPVATYYALGNRNTFWEYLGYQELKWTDNKLFLFFTNGYLIKNVDWTWQTFHNHKLETVPYVTSEWIYKSNWQFIEFFPYQNQVGGNKTYQIGQEMTRLWHVDTQRNQTLAWFKIVNNLLYALIDWEGATTESEIKAFSIENNTLRHLWTINFWDVPDLKTQDVLKSSFKVNTQRTHSTVLPFVEGNLLSSVVYGWRANQIEKMSIVWVWYFDLSQKIIDEGMECSEVTEWFETYKKVIFNKETDNGKQVCYKVLDTKWKYNYFKSPIVQGIDTSAPTWTIEYTNNGNSVTVKLTTSEPVKDIPGWTKQGTTGTIWTKDVTTVSTQPEVVEFEDITGNKGAELYWVKEIRESNKPTVEFEEKKTESKIIVKVSDDSDIRYEIKLVDPTSWQERNLDTTTIQDWVKAKDYTVNYTRADHWKKVKVIATDKFDNVTEKEFTIEHFDILGPDINISLPGDDTYLANITDSSNIQSIKTWIDNWWTPTKVDYVSGTKLPITKDLHNKTVYFEATDVHGNTTTKSQVITFSDVNWPEVTINTSTPDKVSATITDNSDVTVTYHLKDSPNNKTPYTSGTELPITREMHWKTIVFIATDKHGNITEKEVPLSMSDVTNPVVQIIQIPNADKAKVVVTDQNPTTITYWLKDSPNDIKNYDEGTQIPLTRDMHGKTLVVKAVDQHWNIWTSEEVITFSDITWPIIETDNSPKTIDWVKKSGVTLTKLEDNNTPTAYYYWDEPTATDVKDTWTTLNVNDFIPFNEENKNKTLVIVAKDQYWNQTVTRINPTFEDTNAPEVTIDTSIPDTVKVNVDDKSPTTIKAYLKDNPNTEILYDTNTGITVTKDMHGKTLVVEVTDEFGNKTTKEIPLTFSDMEGPNISIKNTNDQVTVTVTDKNPATTKYWFKDNPADKNDYTGPLSVTRDMHGKTIVVESTDIHWNTTQKEYVLNFSDINGPTITLDTTIPDVIKVNVNDSNKVASTQYYFQDTPNNKTDYTKPISINREDHGKTLIIESTDEFGNKSTKEHVVTYSDTESPVINWPDTKTYVLSNKLIDLLSGVTVTDNNTIDSSNIVISLNWKPVTNKLHKFTEKGTYTVALNITDAKWNKAQEKVIAITIVWADLEGLRTAVATGKAALWNPAIYSGKDDLNKAITDGEAILNKDNATEEEIATAIQAINDAINKLLKDWSAPTLTVTSTENSVTIEGSDDTALDKEKTVWYYKDDSNNKQKFEDKSYINNGKWLVWVLSNIDRSRILIIEVVDIAWNKTTKTLGQFSTASTWHSDTNSNNNTNTKNNDSEIETKVQPKDIVTEKEGNKEKVRIIYEKIVTDTKTNKRHTLLNNECSNYDFVLNANSNNYFNDTADQIIANFREAGIIKGVDGVNFEPNRGITRAEFLSIVIKGNCLTPVTELEPPFSDLDKNHWTYDVIKTAYNLGLVKWYEDTFVKANSPISRYEAIAVLLRVNSLAIENYGSGFEEVKFTDISSEIKEDLNKAKYFGLVSDKNTDKFYPTKQITRKQVIHTMNRLFWTYNQ